MAKIAKKVAAYEWYTCYPQIISRICHRQPDVYALLEEITLQVLVTYPQQAMWSMIGKSARHHDCFDTCNVCACV
jgi:serine/threonine-protein kinase ATR